jgi:predicted PurR-regulated permease PerM
MRALNRAFHRHVLTRPWLTFVVMCSSFGLFGAGTLNIFSMFSSNWDMLTQQGLMAVATGSTRQLIELLGTLFLAMVFYTVFKACEHALVHRILHPSDEEPHP